MQRTSIEPERMLLHSTKIVYTKRNGGKISFSFNVLKTDW